ncbi:MAG: phenylalanine--tRNA ligase subunit alpha [Nanoarchaeota archaeon]|nr:phenylalanine--tRNA ligase subunit alpha [Nanoarchaeota archaeon]
MDVTHLAQNLHLLERKLLPFLKEHATLPALMQASGMQEVEVMRALQWLSAKAALNLSQEEKERLVLGDNGKSYLKHGLPERRFLKAIAQGPLSVKDVMTKAKLDMNELNICIGLLRKKNAVALAKEKELVASLTPEGKKLLDSEWPEELFLKKAFPLTPSPKDKPVADELLKRKDIVRLEKANLWSAELTATGKQLANLNLGEYSALDRLTPELLQSGKWKGKVFREYELNSKAPFITGGKRHFVNQAMDYMKSVWLEMGFTELSGPSVQTAFWDLDALFVPQDHPARQMQDTFYIKEPSKGKLPKIASEVKKAHESGHTTGSKGWGGTWDEEVAKQLMLITHDTYLSAQMLSKAKTLPLKTFQIMKVFRNEALDWKHLFEFYQVGGIVVDENANFRHLLGYLRQFFQKMGFEKIRIRPAHFPYVEPGCEVEVFHPIKKQWIELGGAGVFRPEMVKPLLGKDIPVLAWGLGLERIISDYYKITSIRDIYKNDIRQLKDMKHWMN